MTAARRGLGRSVATALPLLAALVLGLSGCAAPTPDTGVAATEQPSAAGSPSPSRGVAPGDPAPPPAGARFDYQLGGASEPPSGVTVVARDSTEEPAPGLYSICYINGFQTQPGVEWPDELLLHDADGEPFVDPGWPDEVILDTSTEANRAAIVERHRAVIDGCAEAGFAAVEFDNLDSFTRSDGALSEDDAIALATALVAATHDAGLAAAQKNTLELAERGRDEIGFDFAVTEECDRFDECPGFTAVYGEHVLDIEYDDDLRGDADAVCARADRPTSTIIRDRDLVTPDDDEYFYRSC